MAKIDINKLAGMITEDPDVFLEYDNLCESIGGYPMSLHERGKVAGDPTKPLTMGRQAATDYGVKIRQAERSGDKGAAQILRSKLRRILDGLRFDWQNDPYASELLDV